jgi:ATP-binding cassette subfamily A (ABC1) protein 3
LLADNIAILATPGKLIAKGAPVSLKQDLGEGYSVQVSFTPGTGLENRGSNSHSDLLSTIRAIAPEAKMSTISPNNVSYHLRTRNSAVVGDVLRLLGKEKSSHRISSCDVVGTTIEDIFVRLTTEKEMEIDEKRSISSEESESTTAANLTNGRPMSPIQQAVTIFYKRSLIARRSWLTPVLTILIAVAGSTIPLVYLAGEHIEGCIRKAEGTVNVPLYMSSSPLSPFGSDPSNYILVSPPGALGRSPPSLEITNVTDNATFIDMIEHNYRNRLLGGVSVDIHSGSSLVAWEAKPPGLAGPAMLNLVSNIHFKHALTGSNGDGSLSTVIQATYQPFAPVGADIFMTLRWMRFFAAVMVGSQREFPLPSYLLYRGDTKATYPAFFALYVSTERISSVKAMQMSNGLGNPIGLWLGHLMFDSIPSIILSTIIIIVFATAVNQFNGLGFLVCRGFLTPVHLSLF